jgi:2'-5' RNA ligase
VAIGVSLWFDPTFEDAIRRVWSAMREAGVSAKLAEGPYRPHVTLGIWERLPRPDADAVLGGLAADRSPFEVRFDAFGAFAGPDPGLFAAPTVTQQLRDLHEAVHAEVGQLGEAAFAYHVPEAWNPHCTLAWGLPAERLPDALSVALRTLPLPVTGVADRVGIVDTPAEVELACHPLGADSG